MKNEFLRKRFGRILILGAVFQEALFGIRGMKMPGWKPTSEELAQLIPEMPDSTIVEFGFWPISFTIYFDHKIEKLNP